MRQAQKTATVTPIRDASDELLAAYMYGRVLYEREASKIRDEALDQAASIAEMMALPGIDSEGTQLMARDIAQAIRDMKTRQDDDLDPIERAIKELHEIEKSWQCFVFNQKAFGRLKECLEKASKKDAG